MLSRTRNYYGTMETEIDWLYVHGRKMHVTCFALTSNIIHCVVQGGTGFCGVRFRYLLSAVLSAVCGFGTFKCGFMCGLRFLPIIQRLRFYLEKCSRFAVSNENLNSGMRFE